jgi:hypothetical protein
MGLLAPPSSRRGRMPLHYSRAKEPNDTMASYLHAQFIPTCNTSACSDPFQLGCATSFFSRTALLLAQLFLQGCEILHRSLSEAVLLTTSFMATLHLETQYSPWCEIAWPEFWAFERGALAGDRSNRSNGTSYDKGSVRTETTPWHRAELLLSFSREKWEREV